MAGFNKKNAINAALVGLHDTERLVWKDPAMGAFCDQVVAEISKQCPNPQKTELPIIDGTCDVSITEDLHILALASGGYVNCIATDIGKQVKDDGVEVGELVSYNNTTREWQIRASVTIADASTMTITTGTGEGTASGASLQPIADLVEITKVEYPIGDHPVTLREFEFRGDILTIDLDSVPEDGSVANIYWGKVHTVDDDGSTMPKKFDDILTNGMVAYAALAEATDVTNKVNIGDRAMAEYMRMGQQLLLVYRDALQRIRPVISGGWESTE